MNAKRYVPLLLLLLAVIGAVVWLVARPDDDLADGDEITRAPEAETSHPVLRGASDPGVDQKTSTSTATVKSPTGSDGHPPEKEPIRITGTTGDPTTGDVHLRVVDERGNPRAGVQATLNSEAEDGEFTRTDDAVLEATGATVFERVRPKRAFLLLRIGQTRHSASIPVEGGRITEVEYVMPRGGVVEGVLRHATRGPLAGVYMSVQLDGQDASSYLTYVTDPEGRFRLEGVPRGTHTVRLTGRAVGFRSRVKAQLVVDVDAGVVEQDIVLGRVCIRGTVLDAATGRPVPEVRIALRETHAQATTDAAGLYALEDILPGGYRVTFTKDGYARAISQPIQVTTDEATTVDMELRPAAAVVFHLCTSSGKPVPEVGRARFAVAEGQDGTSGSARIVADETGTARYEQIMPGTYLFTFDLSRHTAEEVAAVVRRGETRVEVTCTPKTDDVAPALRGVIRDARTRKPLGGVTVSRSRRGRGLVLSDTDGTYLFPVLSPGTYRFWVKKDGYGIHQLEGVEVKEGETTERDVELHQAGTLHIHLTDAHGDPVVGNVTLVIHPREGTEGTDLGTGVVADATGHAVYTRILPGSYRITVVREGTRGSIDAEMGLGETTVHIRLE